MDKPFESVQERMDKHSDALSRRMDRFVIQSLAPTAAMGGMAAAAIRYLP